MVNRLFVQRVGPPMLGVVTLAAIGLACLALFRRPGRPGSNEVLAALPSLRRTHRPRQMFDTSGFAIVAATRMPWKDDATLEQVAEYWRDPTRVMMGSLDADLSAVGITPSVFVARSIVKAVLFNCEGDARRAYETLALARTRASSSEDVSCDFLYTLIYFQGVTALRLGENENCVMCRGESSCILPIAPSAVHLKPEGSRGAIRHFTEYLDQFPDDLEVRWLLNIAHMTLGEHPAKVDPKYLISLERFEKSEFDIGRFVDVGHDAGVDRRNTAGGAIMDDFDGDGRLDLFVTSFDQTASAAFYRNNGDGTFDDRSDSVGLSGQLGGLVCYQADYNNDGRLDVYIPRGAWLSTPIRPSLLRNDGGTFTDVTESAGLLHAMNSNSASWADFDNDGLVDLFVACERQPNRLYRNKGDGTFEDVAERAGVTGSAGSFAKGSTWIDYDNDDFPDLYLNNLAGPPRLFRNRRDGTFESVEVAMNVTAPSSGFSCWTFDYDNDGWLDLFATCYDRSLDDVVRGLIGIPHGRQIGRLLRNDGSRRFVDVTHEAGLDQVYATMGSNYGDLDNDGFLDFYLGTGEPSFATLIPNRMFKNVAGKRFAEITGTSRTGHLQKGHGVAIGDYDRDGDVDIFIETGGAVHGDMYHDILFRNPGQENRSLTVKLVGKKTNRAAIGTRIKVVTAGPEAMTIHRHVSSGSSFGANPLEQTIGLGKADRVAVIEVHWPTSGTTQVVRDVPAGGAIEITEATEGYRRLGPGAVLYRK